MLAVLVATRREKGLTQQQLANRLKRSQSLVAQVEIGQRRLDVPELFDFADALSIDVRVLIDRIARWE